MFTVRRILALTAALAVLVWVGDAAVDAGLFGERTFAGQVLRPSAHEVYIRLLAIGCLGIAGLAWSASVRRARAARTRQAAGVVDYRTLVEASPDCVVVHTDGRPVFANRRALDYWGLADVDELARETFASLIHPDDHAQTLERIARLESGQEDGGPTEVRLRRADGSWGYVVVNSAPIRYGDRPSVLSVFRDITADVETRRDLMASRERLRLALEAARDGVWDWDVPSGRMVYSRSWAAMLGLELEDVAPDDGTWEALIHPEDRPRARALLHAHLRGEVPAYETEVRLRHARGHWIWVLDRGKVVERDAEGRPLRMTGTHRDITDRKEAELALEVRNRLAETFLTGSGPGIYVDVLALVCDATGSPAGLLGTFDAEGAMRVAARRPAGEVSIVPADARPEAVARVAALDHAVIEPGEVDLDGGGQPFRGALAVPVSTRDQVLGLLAVGDRAEPYGPADRAFLESLAGYLAPIMQSHLANEATEAQLRQAQKMEALGALAGGIAHDFNNILQAILGFTTLARQDAPADSNLARDLDRVLKATRRGEELVRRILLFSRREEQEVRPVEAAEVVQAAVNLLRPTLPPAVALEVDLAPDAGRVVGDAAQLSQMVLNLATNALHAMERDGGTLSIGLRRVAAGAGGSVPPALADRDLVAVAVADTGVGMDRPTLDRLFDPFFTTKDVGKGTGLGLSVVHGIVTAHGGDIRVASAPGRGTVATVYLPRLAEPAAPAPGDPGPPPPARPVLFVDDEEPIVSVATAMLERTGLAAEGCLGGEEALARLAEGSDRYEILVTDAAMPDVDGMAMVRRWRELRPGGPVVVITGHDEAAVPDEAREGGPTVIIRKPFTGEALAAAVREALAAAARDAGDGP